MLMPSSNTVLFVIRPLSSVDSAAYRALRQRILSTDDSRFFSDSYEREKHLTDDEWQEWCTEKNEHCILGTFADSELVGIIMITQQGDHMSPVVEWEAAWLDPRYRRTGVGKRFYERARQWSQSHGYKYVAGFIRASYTPALDICADLGFVYVYTIRDELWADGSVADTHAYILDIRQEASEHTSEPIFERFKEVYPFLAQGLHAPQRQDQNKVA